MLMMFLSVVYKIVLLKIIVTRSRLCDWCVNKISEYNSRLPTSNVSESGRLLLVEPR